MDWETHTLDALVFHYSSLGMGQIRIRIRIQTRWIWIQIQDTYLENIDCMSFHPWKQVDSDLDSSQRGRIRIRGAWIRTPLDCIIHCRFYLPIYEQ